MARAGAGLREGSGRKGGDAGEKQLREAEKEVLCGKGLGRLLAERGWL